jgi:hypothetical protein
MADLSSPQPLSSKIVSEEWLGVIFIEQQADEIPQSVPIKCVSTSRDVMKCCVLSAIDKYMAL